ncbi:hypothetical protein [Chromobacterium haemolyticum]|uniref:hypothetical protein n=1 Tax=Chromobacterium haemolyticum TaxID=394935 RepID=UPI0011307481|nr:hypothetical protein [Chromobacterium haemolyticum]
MTGESGLPAGEIPEIEESIATKVPTRKLHFCQPGVIIQTFLSGDLFMLHRLFGIKFCQIWSDQKYVSSLRTKKFVFDVFLLKLKQFLIVKSPDFLI